MPSQQTSPTTAPSSGEAAKPFNPRKSDSKTPKATLRFLPYTAAWQATYESADLLLNEVQSEKQDKLTRRWLSNMERHLNATIITSTLVSSLISGSFSWAQFDQSSGTVFDVPICIWLVKSSWYSGLAFSISSIASACQQIMSLHRLDSHPDGLELFRKMLGGQSSHSDKSASQAEEKRARMQFSQRVLWQTPVMLLNGSLYLYMIGLCIFVYWDITRSIKFQDQPAAILCFILFTIAVLVALFFWGLSSIGLYYWLGQTLETFT